MLLTFQKRWRKALENGLAELRGEPIPYPGEPIKRQTMRVTRRDKRVPKPGELLHLWCPTPRTGKGVKLAAVPCRVVLPFFLSAEHAAHGNVNLTCGDPRVLTGERRFRIASLIEPDHRGPFDRLAWRDGFQSGRELAEWFASVHGLPVEGMVIRW